MIPALHRNAQVRIDLGAIRQNILAEFKKLKPEQKLFAVVKADAYGHGAIKVAKLADKLGVAGFCVALLDEGIELRKAEIKRPILVLGVTDTQYVTLASKSDLSLTVPNLAWLKEAAPILEEKNLQLKIHLAIDSGMSRIGFSEEKEFIATNEFLSKKKCFIVEGMFTHFASADSADLRYFDRQVSRFAEFKKLLKVKPKWIHVDNTAASVFERSVDSDLVRFGIGMYGLNPSSNPASPDLKLNLNLKPALSLVSELVQVKIVKKGQGISYGSTYVTEHDEIIGTVPLGYADGWSRKFQGFKIKVGSEFCPIVGRVCMDQLMVRLPKMMPVKTKVVLISDNPDDPNSIKHAADYLGTIHYEVACRLSSRLPRVYTNE